MAESPTSPDFTLYGIKNCDTVKKARRWLDEQQVAYRFHDYRVDGLTAEMLHTFIAQQGYEALLNTRGTTWRKLSEEERGAVTDAGSALQLMLAHPAIIKRPLLAGSGETSLLGFDAGRYQHFISQGN
ncbi:ArsC family reductase [Chimaeribacter arupi]|jgi:Spx/MgsR family transcriptional regulator|uniref:ArsC family reductase n=1 Tax=Nissabacter archeti TaxID=1917880 RepID=A0ABS5JMH7_9GAMM|nr:MULTISPECIES: ArsC family reductase [Yersiniaceae]MBS0970538.1 ArsC family reductase [Nissabacter archeti]PLR43088.1 ArsC family reductase [Chimaeribacter arupi]PLR48169.1 ArsC family reductase [Chimaeribacter arupi]WKZ93341.1 ArsC family reductase [Chimaeribacter arupi]